MQTIITLYLALVPLWGLVHCSHSAIVVAARNATMSSFPNLTRNPTIAGKLLTPDMFSILINKRTSKLGYDIDNLIESSKQNLSANFTSIPNSAGLLAGDEECYHLFSELIHPIISEVHQIDDMKS